MASCSRTTTGKDNKASHKTALKWEKEFETLFDCDLSGKDVIRLLLHYSLNGKNVYAQLQTFPLIISDPEQHPLKRIALNRTVCQSHTKEHPISNSKANLEIFHTWSQSWRIHQLDDRSKECVLKMKMLVVYCLTQHITLLKKSGPYQTFLIY